MDPLSIATAVLALFGAAVHLDGMRKQFKEADKTLVKIQRNCHIILEILRHFQRLLVDRGIVLSPDDRLDSVHLETSLNDNCNGLAEDVESLLDQLATYFTPGRTNGEQLLNGLRRHSNIRTIQRAHAAIKERLEVFKLQQSTLNSDNLWILVRQNSQSTSFSSTRDLELDTASTVTSSTISPQKSPSSLYRKVYERYITMLLKAIHTNDIQTARRILRDISLDPNGISPARDERLPLLVATLKGNCEMVGLLLYYKADIALKDSKGRTALHLASIRNRADLVSILLRNGAEPGTHDSDGHTPLWHAARSKKTGESFHALINTDGNIAMDESKDDELPTPLWAAAKGGHLDRVSKLLERGASVDIKDQNGRTLVHQTVAQGRVDIAAMVLDKMVEQRGCTRADASNVQDACGLTPLMCGAMKGSLPVVISLVRGWHASYDLRDENGNDGFYYACAGGHIAVASFLLGSGAAVNMQNKYGNSPLHIAATQGHEDIVQLLLHSSADTEAMSRKIRDEWAQGGAQMLPGSVTPAEAARLARRDDIAEQIDSFVKPS
ncbi:hypothetical protein NM208_g1340 [Fusarium decemcellulare]|uniref:Uncharacterized protein n=2 Tax=Fusarium decemcellulare TaxID=57161 RepID=A0ACC1SKW8_9HYPO|nr:hypothetical protein NM208_g4365 [Fusarium decemcellulare]KAJ3547775.1 hypothetical protein NM208_g1340 [Fusarium decemcellulare]